MHSTYVPHIAVREDNDNVIIKFTGMREATFDPLTVFLFISLPQLIAAFYTTNRSSWVIYLSVAIMAPFITCLISRKSNFTLRLNKGNAAPGKSEPVRHKILEVTCFREDLPKWRLMVRTITGCHAPAYRLMIIGSGHDLLLPILLEKRAAETITAIISRHVRLHNIQTEITMKVVKMDNEGKNSGQDTSMISLK